MLVVSVAARPQCDDIAEKVDKNFLMFYNFTSDPKCEGDTHHALLALGNKSHRTND